MRRLLLLVLAIVLGPASAMAQSTTGTIRGRVVDGQNLAMPGVTVEVSSPNLQGVRTVVTSENGEYIVAQLPAGAYTLTFELSGFQTQKATVNVVPTLTVPVDIKLGLASLSETIQVVGTSTDALTKTAQVATDFKQEMIALLPTNRTLDASLLMAPSVHATGPSGNYTIAGSMSYDTLFMVNGVNVNENLRGQANALFIEDAIQETTISTAGISAEFGRFGGGVVNVITKSGGNMFSGSFRDTLYNDNWRALTPYSGDVKTDKMVPTYEYTLGGPVMRDHVWFFTAGRLQTQEESPALAITRIPFDFTRDQKRFEGKSTLSPNPNHSFVVNGVKINDKQTNDTFNRSTSMDVNSLYNRETPQNLWSASYNGVLSTSFFLEARVSQRHFTFIGSGSPYTDPIKGTLLIDNKLGTRYWSPTFCGVCDPEKRDNKEFFAKGTYYLSTKNGGSHNMVFGYDAFDDQRFANNHQSGSDWRILGTSTIVQNGTIYPQWLGDDSTTIQYNPIAIGSSGTNFWTHSLFYNDNWRATERLTVNAGIRWDKNHGLDSAGNLVARDNAFSPRAGVVWDPLGDQQWSVTGSFAKYVTMISNSIADSASPAGQPATYRWLYQGPSINPPGTTAPVSPDVAIQQLFAWFNANGGQNRTATTVTLPGVATKILGSLDSPYVYEYAAGLSRQIGQRGSVRLDGVFRKYNGFYATQTDPTTGKVTDNLNRTYDLSTIVNTDIVTRRYSGMTVAATYRWSPVDVGGNYTLGETYGNFNGENVSSGPVTSGVLAYPQYSQPSWSFPSGDLASDQRHHGRLWLNYHLAALKGLTFSALEDIGSGLPYGAVGPVDARSYVTNPGYITPQGGSTQSYAFTGIDAFRTEAYTRTDLAANYSYKVKAASHNLDFYAQAQLLNVFGQEPLCACGGSVFVNGGNVNVGNINTSVLTNWNGNPTLARFNPMTTTAIEGTNWSKGPIFGQAVNRNAYQSPRTFRLSFGIRF